MLREDAAEPLRQEVQRAVRQRERQAVGAVLLLGQQAARVLADLAGGAQRVRPDDARQRARARRRRARRRPRRSRCSSRAIARSACAIKDRTASAARSAPRSSSMPAARRRCCRTASSCGCGIRSSTRARSGPTGKAPIATPAATRAPRWCSRRPTRTAGSGTSRCTTTSSRVGVVAPFDYLFKGRKGDHEQTYQRRSRDDCPAVKERIDEREARHRLFRDARLLVSLDAGRRRRLGARRRRVRLPRSALFVRRAAGAASPASWPPTRSSTGLTKGDTSAAQLGAWGDGFNQGVDRMRRLVCEYYDGFSFGTFVTNYPRPAQHRDRPADRRPVHRRGRQGLGADGIALRARSSGHPALASGTSGELVRTRRTS